MKIRFLVFGAICLFACGQRKEVVAFHENNNPKIINYYSGPNSHNYVQKGFYDTGEVEYVVWVENREMTGLYQEYYKNMQLKLEKTFASGQAQGIEIGYHQNRSKSSEAEFVDGLINGEVTTWYNNGEIKEKKVYKNDTLNGVSYHYDEFGVLIEEILYNMGEVVNEEK